MPIAKTLFVWGHYTDEDPFFSTGEVVEWTQGYDSEEGAYDFKIELVEGCRTDENSHIAKSVANGGCAKIFESVWKGCGNQGRGGSVAVGCFIYSISTKF